MTEQLEFVDGTRLSWQVTSETNEHGDLIVTISATHNGGIAECVAQNFKLGTLMQATDHHDHDSLMCAWFEQAKSEPLEDDTGLLRVVSRRDMT